MCEADFLLELNHKHLEYRHLLAVRNFKADLLNLSNDSQAIEHYQQEIEAIEYRLQQLEVEIEEMENFLSF